MAGSTTNQRQTPNCNYYRSTAAIGRQPRLNHCPPRPGSFDCFTSASRLLNTVGMVATTHPPTSAQRRVREQTVSALGRRRMDAATNPPGSQGKLQSSSLPRRAQLWPRRWTGAGWSTARPFPLRIRGRHDGAARTGRLLRRGEARRGWWRYVAPGHRLFATTGAGRFIMKHHSRDLKVPLRRPDFVAAVTLPGVVNSSWCTLYLLISCCKMKKRRHLCFLPGPMMLYGGLSSFQSYPFFFPV